MANWDDVKRIFAEAAELPAQNRAAYIETACAGDDSLLAEVCRLLEAHDDADEFLQETDELAPGSPGSPDSPDSPGSPGGAAALHPPRRTDGTLDEPHSGANRFPPKGAGGPGPSKDVGGPGLTIDRYELLEQIGEGGFGVVYLAQQRTPIRRRVALKLIKPGMDTRAVCARFDHERQALAMMDHPNIARILDGGATPTSGGGRPYFVMELVRGVPITEYCDVRRLAVRQRLDLFLDVCRAVAHAHRKGIIHRDLKPSNVLVTEQDGAAIVKIIDFGIAKALHESLGAGHTAITQFRQFVGTPKYMSPEQAQWSAVDVDTRSDVYTLGVLLYELLCGLGPYGIERSESSTSPEEMRRIVLEKDPERPSTALGRIEPDRLRELSRERSIAAPEELVQELRGDLDWIVLKAMHKDRGLRYQSVDELRSDIERSLRDEPVTAGPPSAQYRLSKFVRRHRMAVAAGGVIAITLLATTILATTLMWWALAERRLAREREALAEQKTIEAQRQEAIASAVNAFLNEDLLAAVAPSAEAGRGRDVLVREVLDEAARRLDGGIAHAPSSGRFAHDPLVEVAIRATIGTTYRQLGEYEAASRHLERALAMTLASPGDNDATILQLLLEITRIQTAQGDYAQAERTANTVIERAAKVPGDAKHHALAARHQLAAILRLQRRLDEAEPLARRVVADHIALYGEEHTKTLRARSTLAVILHRRQRVEEAGELFESVHRQSRAHLGPEHPYALDAMNNYAIFLRRAGRLDESAELLVEVLTVRERIYGEDHPLTSSVLGNLATVREMQGDREASVALNKRSLDIKRRVHGVEHPEYLNTLGNLGLSLSKHGRLDEAAECYAEALDILLRIRGEGDYETIRMRSWLGQVYAAQGRDEDAERMARAALESALRELGPHHSETLVLQQTVGALLRRRGLLDDALPYYERAVGGARQARDRRYHLYLRNLGSVLREMEQFEQAEHALREVAHAWEEDSTRAAPSDRARLYDELAMLYEAWRDVDDSSGDPSGAAEDRRQQAALWRKRHAAILDAGAAGP